LPLKRRGYKEGVTRRGFAGNRGVEGGRSGGARARCTLWGPRQTEIEINELIQGAAVEDDE